MRALNDRLSQMQQKNNQDEMESIDGWPLVDENNSSSTTSAPMMEASPSSLSTQQDNSINGGVVDGSGGISDDDSDKNSADSFVKVPKGTESDPLSD